MEGNLRSMKQINIQIKQNQLKENGEEGEKGREGKEETNVEEKKKGSMEEEEEEMKEKEEKKAVDVNKGFDEVMSIAEKHIDTVNAMYSLGVSWLKDEDDLSGGKGDIFLIIFFLILPKQQQINNSPKKTWKDVT